MRNVALIAVLFALVALVGCSSRPAYETEDWSIAVIDSDTAEATVRYEGFVCSSDSLDKRVSEAALLKELAEDTNPSSPWTPRLKNARRYFLVENDSLIMVEQGELPNPLSWFEQSGLNPVTWFGSDVNMSVKNGRVIKWGFGSPAEIVAASGQVMNEKELGTVLTSLDSANTIANTGDNWDPDGQTVIVWPGEARAFNWKIAGNGYLKNWKSLTPDFEREVAAGVPTPQAVLLKAGEVPEAANEETEAAPSAPSAPTEPEATPSAPSATEAEAPASSVEEPSTDKTPAQDFPTATQEELDDVWGPAK